VLGSQTASVHDRCGGNAGSAAAADLPSRRPPPPVAYAPPLPIFTWTGFYVGVNGGGAFRGNNNSGFNNAVFFGGAGPLVGAGLAKQHRQQWPLHRRWPGRI
jgi:outer membrane immunogenic protein